MSITKRDVLELRRRLSKKECTISRMSGCYVNGDKEILLRFSEPFLDLEEDEFYKYLEIAKKALSGTLGNNLLELEFDRTEEARERQQFFFAMKGDGLKSEALLDRFYEQVIRQYDCAGNYLILLFHDKYDVLSRTTDRGKLDESEEVYSYFICAICPVELSKPGLGYREADHRIGVCARDWIVGLPDIGFLYPAFSDWGSDSNAVMYYMKNAKYSHPDFVTGMLGCGLRRTAAEEKQLFRDIVEDAFGGEEEAENVFLTIQRNLDGVAAMHEEDTPDHMPMPAMTVDAVIDVMADIDMPEPVRAQITQTYAQEFGESLPTARHLLDPKLAAEGAKRAQTLALQNKVETLEQQLAAAHAAKPEADTPWAETEGQIALQVPESVRTQLETRVIDGARYLLVPLGEDETARINGVPTALA